MYDPASLIRPYPADEMTVWPVSTRMNRPGNDNPGIFDRVEFSQSLEASDRPGLTDLSGEGGSREFDPKRVLVGQFTGVTY